MYWKYEYHSGPQYQGADLKGHSKVFAEYRPSVSASGKGNPFIEALPPLLSEKIELAKYYSHSIPEYNPEKAEALSQSDKLTCLEDLRLLRLQLPFHKTIEPVFFNLLQAAYSQRDFIFSETGKIPVRIGNEDKLSCSKLKGDDIKGTSGGAAVLGFPGCGKTSAIGMLTDHFPQVIVHKLPNGVEFSQILYITTNCIGSNNFSALYDGLAASIDDALGNLDSFYLAAMQKKKTLGAKQNYLCELIDLFAIGVIILDEIQLMSFDSESERSFSAIMTISNKTKVQFMVIGTNDANVKMFSNAQTTRRVGSRIVCDTYLKEKAFANNLLQKILFYQWITPRIPDPLVDGMDALPEFKEISDTFYEETKGSIDQMIRLSQFVQMEWLRTPHKGKVDGPFVKRVSEKYFSAMKPYLEEAGESQAEKALYNLKLEADRILKDLAQEAQQQQFMDDDVKETEEQALKILKNKVIESVQMYSDDYSEEQILAALNQVISQTGTDQISVKDFVRKTLNYLCEPPVPETKSSKKPRKEKASKSREKKEETMSKLLRNFVDPTLEESSLSRGS